MKVCCARRMIHETIAGMKAADPLISGVADGDFIFSNDELFKALQVRYSLPIIQDIIDTLLPTLDYNPCTCGTTDPLICGVPFVAIIDDMFAKPTTQ